MNKQFLRFIFFLLVYLALPLTATAQIVNIPDPNLRAKIGETLGKASGATITTSDMARLTHLTAENANITDLTGLEHATNLTKLFFSGEYVEAEGRWINSNSVSDLSPLSGLTNLTRLTIHFDAITDISPLSGLTSLTRLSLWGNSITDISAVASLTNLTELSFGSNNITDISPVSDLTNLTELWLSGNNITDISALADLTNLATLWPNNNNISDISPLASLTNLTELNLRHNNISDISPLIVNTGLGSGDEVLLNDNPLSSVSIKTYVPALQGRGVTVEFDDTTHLNVGEPRTVRLIYFLPNDRPYRVPVVQRLKDDIRKAQVFFAEQMEAHGYGNKTFRFETDTRGEPIVHRVDGQHPNSHYFYDMESKMREEIKQTFNLDANLYFIVLGTDAFRKNDGQTGGGTGHRHGKIGGYAMVSRSLGFELTAHELGHAFGLYHDFRDGSSSTFIMSYGRSRNQLSVCHAEYLVMNPYFNADVPIEHGQPPTIKLISSRTYPVGSKSVPIQLKISDSEGLHQVLLFVRTSKSQGIDRAPQLKSCRGLEGKKETIVEFDYDGVIPSDGSTSFSNPMTHPISVEVVNINGNVARTNFVLFSEVLQPLTKNSGDNQIGLPNTPLPVPFVVQIRNSDDGAAGRRIAVTFTVTAGGGTLSTTSTITDENNRAESRLTLGPNLGTTTVEVSAAGIEGTVTFTAVAGAAVEILDSNLRAAIEKARGKAPGTPIAPSDMASLTHLTARGANITNLTGLEFATNLTNLNLGYGEGETSHAVKDLSPLADLTQLTSLHLPGSSISDISAVAGLTNLTWLNLWGNPISDITPVVELTKLKDLYLGSNNISDISPLVANTGLGSGDTVNVQGNPLSYLSIHTHIPALQSRGVTVEFDNRAQPALLKISGDDQNGASLTPLSQPFVVEAQDANGSALTGILVRFAVTAGGGTLRTTITRTDENGRAQSTLTLGPNIGTNTVEVSATGIKAPVTFHAISDTESPPITADVNNDGVVNVLDLVVIASEFGNQGQNLAADANGDGIVNILDLILVAGMFDGAAAAPAVQSQVPKTLTAVEVQGWLTGARALEIRDPIMKRGFRVLEQLLVSLTPKETEPLPNYPNPFNPETWMPYRLAEDAFVRLTIYDSSGHVVRTLEVGHQIASAYESRSKAIYWDGRNNIGEQVASGVYFYTLSAGEYSATRRMLIIK